MTKGQEIWLTVKNYPLYQVSSFGNIKRILRDLYCGHKGSKPQSLQEKILKPFLSFDYKRIRLYHNFKHKDFSIHRLVAEHFINNPKNLAEVNHKDGNKLNNNKENLEWVSRSGNQKHAFKLGLNQSGLINGKNTRFKKGSIPWNKKGEKT